MSSSHVVSLPIDANREWRSVVDTHLSFDNGSTGDVAAESHDGSYVSDRRGQLEVNGTTDHGH